MGTAMPVRPLYQDRDKFWHNVRLPNGKLIRVGWSDGRWRTVKKPYSPAQAGSFGWEYVGLDTLPETEPNY